MYRFTNRLMPERRGKIQRFFRSVRRDSTFQFHNHFFEAPLPLARLVDAVVNRRTRR